MNIVHVVETLDRGGLERMVCDLAAEQSRRGHSVSVQCLFREGLLGAELRAVNINVSSAGKRSGADLGAVLRLRRALRARRPDVIHTHNATAHYHTVAAMLFGRPAPIINTRHGMGGLATRDRRETWFKASLVFTAKVVAVCQHAAAQFMSRGLVHARKLTVIPNGIVLDRFSHGERLVARRKLSIPDSAIVIGTVGRLNWAKDHQLLLSAAALLHPRHQSLRVVIIGEGEGRNALSSAMTKLGLESCVLLLGDRSDVADLLAGFDIFVLSSRTEGYSVALLEAAAAGLPLIATDVGGNSEIVQAGTSGALVPHGDAQALAAAIEALIADGGRRTREAAAARHWAQQHASVSTMVDRYQALYSQVAGNSAVI